MRFVKRGLLGLLGAAGIGVVLASFWFWFTPVGVNNYINKVTIQAAMESPELITRLGLIDNTVLDFHSGKLADYTKEADERSLEKLRAAREGLDNYGPEGLEGQELLSWKIAAWFFDEWLVNAEMEHSGYRVNQISGVTVNLPEFLTDAHAIIESWSVEQLIGCGVRPEGDGLLSRFEIGMVRDVDAVIHSVEGCGCGCTAFAVLTKQSSVHRAVVAVAAFIVGIAIERVECDEAVGWHGSGQFNRGLRCEDLLDFLRAQLPVPDADVVQTTGDVLRCAENVHAEVEVARAAGAGGGVQALTHVGSVQVNFRGGPRSGAHIGEVHPLIKRKVDAREDLPIS